jgi:hypothetical protein
MTFSSMRNYKGRCETALRDVFRNRCSWPKEKKKIGAFSTFSCFFSPQRWSQLFELKKRKKKSKVGPSRLAGLN